MPEAPWVQRCKHQC